MLIGGGFYFYWYGIQQYRLKKAVQYTPTSKAIGVAPGITEVSGEAHKFRDTFTAPFTRTECLYYSTALYKWSGSGKHRRKNLVQRWESNKPFALRDDTGITLVQPNLRPKGGCTYVELKVDRKERERLGAGVIGRFLGQADVNSGLLYNFVEQYWPELVSYADKLEVHETYIQEGDQLFVLGTAAESEYVDDTPTMQIRYDKSRKFFCMSEGSERNALTKLTLESTLCPLLAPAVSYLGYSLLLHEFNVISETPFWIGKLVAISLYAWLGFLALIEMYNGLIQLRNNLDRAGANIDTLLKLRLDLVPQLVEVVRDYQKYEKELLPTLVALRDLPIGEANSRLSAVRERYPDLKANNSFLLLQNQLSSIEDRIAASRAFYNDSVAIYNAQIERFPYLLFAGSMGLDAVQYLKV